MLHQGALHLEGPDAVSAALDQVVVAAHIPEIPVLVLPCHVAGVVHPAPQAPRRQVRIAVVSHEHPHRADPVPRNDELALFARIARCAVRPRQEHPVQRRRTPHRTGLRRHAREIAHAHRHLRLPVGFHQRQTRRLPELLEHLRIQRLARHHGIFQPGKIVLRQILLDQEPVHGRRGAEGRHPVCRADFEGPHRRKLVVVVHKDRAAADPLAVDLAPGRLGPARVRHGVVQPAVAHVLPVFRRDNVRQRIGEIVRHHLGLPRRPRREIHQHQVIVPRGGFARRTLPRPVRRRHLRRQVAPARPLSVQAHLEHRAARGGGFRLFDRRFQGRLGHRDHHADPGLLEAIGQIVFRQHVRGRHPHGSQLVQPQQARPELVPALQDQQHRVALAHPLLPEHLRRPVAVRLQLPERHRPFRPLVVAPDHRPALRLGLRVRIHHVVGEIEILRHPDLQPVAEFLVGGKLRPGQI